MPARVFTLLFAAWILPAAARAGENANLAAAELLRGAAPAVAETLAARYPNDYAALLPEAAGLAMLPGTGAAAADIQAQARALIAHAVGHIEQRDADFVLRAPDTILRPVIVADRALMQAARTAGPSFCLALLEGQEPAIPPGPIADALSARTAALLTAIADGRDHAVTARRANPDDYKALTSAARGQGVDVAAWAVMAPDNLAGAEPATVCAAMISVDGTVLGMQDDLADRILADLAAVLTHQGN